MLGKKADGGFTAVVIILIIVFALGWLINQGGRECSSNNECKDEYYCGSDFACHKIPVIEKTITETPTIVERDYRSLTGPFIILGFTIIIAALILKIKKNKKQEKQTQSLTPYLSQSTNKTDNPRKVTKDISKTNIVLAAIAGAIIVCLLFLIILISL